MKKLISCVLTLAMILVLFTGCAAPATQDPSPASPENSGEANPEGEKLTIGLALSGINSNAIFIDMAKDIQERCDAAGYKLMTADIAEDPNKVVTALENFINGGCDVIIFQNYAEEACATLLADAIDKGIIIGSYDYTSDYAQYACIASNYEVGKVIGQECGKWVKANEGSKKVALCSYSPLDFLVEREQGMRDGFAETCPEGEIAIALDAGFTPEGVTAGENFLQAVPDLQAVMGINDGGTLGVYEAFKAAGMSFEKNQVAIFGCDASADGLNAIREGDMFFSTIDLDLVNQVAELYQRCVDAALGGTIDASKAVVTYPVNPLYFDDLKK